jgi:hypothetical protein
LQHSASQDPILALGNRTGVCLRVEQSARVVNDHRAQKCMEVSSTVERLYFVNWQNIFCKGCSKAEKR